jgi:circadian clock protein KaiC
MGRTGSSGDSQPLLRTADYLQNQLANQQFRWKLFLMSLPSKTDNEPSRGKTSQNSHPVSGPCSTGIAGLDEILAGGLPRNRIYLAQGDPGVGKTTLALRFLLEGAKLGEKGLYITLSETRDELLGVAESHGWQLDQIAIFELSAMEQQLAQSLQNTLFHPADLELNKTTKMLLDQVEKVQPSRVALDSLSELRLLSEDPLRYRRQMLAMKQFFAGRNCTVIMLDDRISSNHSDLQVQTIAHGVITLAKRELDYGAERRRIKIDKLRGVDFRAGQHEYVIHKGGIEVFPRLRAAGQHRKFPQEPVSSGLKGLDDLLGGGLDRGTSNLILGPSGTGKSAIAHQCAIASAERGEKVLIFAFDENKETILRRTGKLGMPLAENIEAGRIVLEQVDPTEIPPGEFSHRIKEEVEKNEIRMLILDSLIGYLQAMPDERFLSIQLHELLTYLSQQGVVSILTVAQHGLIGQMQAPFDVTYLADTVILMRYFETSGRVKKAISVIKKRSGSHEDTIRECRIERGGIQVGSPLTDFHGVLTGVPVFKGGTEQMIK